jgi:nicotinate phosphoribosyltransferase
MAQARYLLGAPEPKACFSLSFRTNPFAGGFAVCAGLGLALEYLRDWSFSDADIEYLRLLKAPDGTALFDESFLAHLAGLTFTGDVKAIEEGTLVFGGEPILQVIGPVALGQMVETPLLNIINFSTLIATKAARCVLVAQDDKVLEFGLRRAQGPDGGLMASRAAYVGGVDATSNTRAGRLYGIPVAGTHAHSWIMSFSSEIDAFRAYVQTSANNAILLVDTYDTLQGVRNAITVAHEMETRGERLRGIRIDSGDLAWLSRKARAMLDQANLGYVKIVASNALDEYTVSSLKAQGAAVDMWGIGTQMVTGGTYSALDGVYKMTAIQDTEGVWQPRMKVSDQISKATLPGVHGVRRYYDANGMMAGDMVYDALTFSQSGGCVTMVDPADVTRYKRFDNDARYQELLVPVMDKGAICGELLTPEYARARLKTDIEYLDDSRKRFLRPHSYPVGIEEHLSDARIALMQSLRGDGDE